MSAIEFHATPHKPIKVIFVNHVGETLKVTAPSFGIAYDTAMKIDFEVYDYEVEEGEEYCAV
jgi:hypothetical protein